MDKDKLDKIYGEVMFMFHRSAVKSGFTVDTDKFLFLMDSLKEFMDAERNKKKKVSDG